MLKRVKINSFVLKWKRVVRVGHIYYNSYDISKSRKKWQMWWETTLSQKNVKEKWFWIILIIKFLPPKEQHICAVIFTVLSVLVMTAYWQELQMTWTVQIPGGLSIWQNWSAGPLLYHCSTSQFENEIGFFQEFLLKDHLLRAYYSGFDWSGRRVLIKREIITATGMVWPVSSDKWKAPQVPWSTMWFFKRSVR